MEPAKEYSTITKKRTHNPGKAYRKKVRKARLALEEELKGLGVKLRFTGHQALHAPEEIRRRARATPRIVEDVILLDSPYPLERIDGRLQLACPRTPTPASPVESLLYPEGWTYPEDLLTRLKEAGPLIKDRVVTFPPGTRKLHSITRRCTRCTEAPAPTFCGQCVREHLKWISSNRIPEIITID